MEKTLGIAKPNTLHFTAKGLCLNVHWKESLNEVYNTCDNFSKLQMNILHSGNSLSQS